jgi:hypothetical protein
MSRHGTRARWGGRLAAALVAATGLTAGAASAGAEESPFTLAVSAHPWCTPLAPFDPAAFPEQPRIDNRWLPLVPGSQRTLEGTARDGGTLVRRRVVFTVTDLTKVVAGVRTVVVYDVDANDGEVAEAELAFFAQDRAGNVWNLGEYPEEYEGGRFAGAPSTWIAGLQGAEGGVHMAAEPRLGLSYLQGVAPRIDFLDCAQVYRPHRTTCGPAGCFHRVLVTREKSPLDRGGGLQTKHHAPGVGIVRIGAVRDPEGEQLDLTAADQLTGAALRELRQAALRLDDRGHRVSEVYARTPPLERPDDGG